MIFEKNMPVVARGNRVGLFGGSFNPPHEGHVLVAKTAQKRLKLDQIWWMVTPGNPLKDHQELRPLKERLHLVQNLVHDQRMKITGFEQKLKSHKTIDSLNHVLARNNGVQFVWIMGGDSLAKFHHWHDWQRIAKIIPIAIIDRPTAKMSALSSPMAQRFWQFRINESDCAALPCLPPPAWSYIHGRLSIASSTLLRKSNA